MILSVCLSMCMSICNHLSCYSQQTYYRVMIFVWGWTLMTACQFFAFEGQFYILYGLVLQEPTISIKKYINPARGILDFCKQRWWPLPCSRLTNSIAFARFTGKPLIMSRVSQTVPAFLTRTTRTQGIQI